MKFPTIKEMAEEVAEKALDEFEYKGKTLRQWIEIILATDTNVGTKDGTNLASLGTDCISRRQAIEALDEQIEQCDKALSSFDISMKDGFAVKVERASLVAFRETLEYLPSAQPETNCSEFPNNSDTISRQAAIEAVQNRHMMLSKEKVLLINDLEKLPSAEPKRGKWILDRSGAYCCSECMEPCATYVMMKPRDKFCKMCGAKMEE